MPTKRNRSNQQQPYVPAGNGDASGEYTNESGSNKHFTSFKKPDSVEETGSTPSVKAKDSSQITEIKDNNQLIEQVKNNKVLETLTPKQRYEILNYINGRRDYIKEGKEEKLIGTLRYYTGTFGDLSKYSDDDLKSLFNDVLQTDFRTSEDYSYIKKGAKWYRITSTQKQMYDIAGVKTYTEEEKLAKESKDISNLVNKSQSSTDKEIQGLMGENCVVCFGKGYSKEDTQQIVEATKVLVDEFPSLKNFVSMMGDRNNLEKYINAMKEQTTFTEQQIADKMKEIKARYYFGAPSDDVLRRSAISELQSKITLSNPGNAYAYWQPSSRAMIFRGIMKKTDEQQFNSEFEHNFKSSGKKISVYYHEMGHGIDSMFENVYRKKLDFVNSLNDFQKRVEFNNMYAEFNNKKKELIKQNFNPNYGQKALDEYNRIHNTRYPTMHDFENRFTFLNHKIYEENKEMESLIKKYGEKKYNISKYGATNENEFVAECFAAHYTGMDNQLATDLVNLYKEYFTKMEEFK